MAVTNELKWGATTLNLRAAAGAGWRVRRWMPKAGLPLKGRDPDPVVEELDCKVEASSHDNLAAHLQAMDAMRVWADRYMKDRTVEDPVWWHCKMEDETGERRALVRRIELDFRSDLLEATAWAKADKARVMVRITRGPYWERTAARAIANGSEQAGASITHDYTGGGSPHDIVGDAPARIQRLYFGSDASGAAFGRLWVGLRSADKHGTLANFINIWECEVAGASLGTDAARVEDVAASPGANGNTQVTITPGTATWAKRLIIELQDVTANEQDNFGDFLWLLRHKLSANSSTWEVQLRFGYSGMSDDNFVRNRIVELDNTDWDYAEMGWMRIPLRDFHALLLSDLTDATDKTFCIQVWARRTSGSANLSLDCLCPIPVDEGFLKLSNFTIAAGTAGFLFLGESPEGTMQALAYSSDSFTHIAAMSALDFKLPIGDGRMICTYAGPSNHSILTGIYVQPAGGSDYFERWLSLRGAE